MALLTVKDLTVKFLVARKNWWSAPIYLEAVRGVSFEIMPGKALGIVGESGSGKTTTAMATLQLEESAGGIIEFEGENLNELDDYSLRMKRKDIQLIFQDPYSSLNPRVRVGDIVREPMDLLDIGPIAKRQNRVAELFEQVGLRSDQMNLFPHQFSGGQRQRISIARALSTNPKLLVCDEPVSALDVAIQAQILNLLSSLKDELGLSYLFISHDLGVVRHVCDDVAVMYLGKIVEQGRCEDIFKNPQHPYTKALLAAAPSLEQRKSKGYQRRVNLQGDPPSPINPPKGCAFHDRCPIAIETCKTEQPGFTKVEKSMVSCHCV